MLDQNNCQYYKLKRADLDGHRGHAKMHLAIVKSI